MPQIRPASTPHDLLAVYAFRYAAGDDAARHAQDHVDHARCLVRDPLDRPEASVLAAWLGTNVVGTLRNNFLASGDIGEYDDLYHLLELDAYDRVRSSITTRFVIHPQHRSGPLGMRLFMAAYRVGIAHGIRTDYVGCDATMLPFFTGLGYRPHRVGIRHAELGIVNIMRLDLLDSVYLERVGSPLWRAVSPPARSTGSHQSPRQSS